MGICNVQDTKKRADVSKMIKLLSNCQGEQKLVGESGNHTIVFKLKARSSKKRNVAWLWSKMGVAINYLFLLRNS